LAFRVILCLVFTSFVLRWQYQSELKLNFPRVRRNQLHDTGSEKVRMLEKALLVNRNESFPPQHTWHDAFVPSSHLKTPSHDVVQYQALWKSNFPRAPHQNPFIEYDFISKLTLYGAECPHFHPAHRPKFCGISDNGLEHLVQDESHEQLERARAECRTKYPGAPCKFYSQQAEDATLFNMLFSTVKRGFYLEFGAVDGVLYSNTLFLEQSMGWSGVLLEASPSSFKALQQNRGQNNRLFNLAICSDPGKRMFRGTDAEGGIDEHLPDDRKRPASNLYSVECDTMRNVLSRANVTSIDFWSLDVEGGELDVLNSMDWSISVRVLLVERNANDVAIERLLVNKGFVYVRQLRGLSLGLQNAKFVSFIHLDMHLEFLSFIHLDMLLSALTS
jgi:FkbM family methyltransferase